MENSELMYNKGDIITCPNGHEICEFAIDVYITAPIHASNFTKFRPGQRVIKATDDIKYDSLCSICGLSYKSLNKDRRRLWFHIKDKGWI